MQLISFIMKQALARAVYSRQPLVLLDDVFSGMDARTVYTVARGLLGVTGLLRKNKATVIIATHNRKSTSPTNFGSVSRLTQI